MSSKFRVKLWGAFALFSRPEFSAERVSYDVITPSAAVGVLEAIHWKPAITWVIDRIHVLNPIRFDTLRRNEVGTRLPTDAARQAAAGKPTRLESFADEDRQQRASLLLRDVAYVVDAHFELTDRAGPGDNPGKHAEMMRRRLEKGQCVQQPCFGCREFPAFFEPFVGPDPTPPDALRGARDLGWMLHHIAYRNWRGPGAWDGPDLQAEPKFFRAQLVDGVMAVPRLAFGDPTAEGRR